MGWKKPHGRFKHPEKLGKSRTPCNTPTKTIQDDSIYMYILKVYGPSLPLGPLIWGSRVAITLVSFFALAHGRLCVTFSAGCLGLGLSINPLSAHLQLAIDSSCLWNCVLFGPAAAHFAFWFQFSFTICNSFLIFALGLFIHWCCTDLTGGLYRH